MTLFDNTKVAFADKSDKDLRKSYFLFSIIRNPFIMKILTYLVKIAIRFHLPIIGIIKATIYKQFCGGTTINDSRTTIDNLWKYQIGTILDFSSEGKRKKEDFIHAKNEIIATIIKAKELKSIPFAVFKPTGIVQFSILEKLSANQKLNQEEQIEKKEFLLRMNEICATTSRNKVPLFIDAEESWIQSAIDDIVKQMMRKYNSKKAFIFNTIQMYKKDRIVYLKELFADAKNLNYFLGLKLVRGAYHEQEVERAMNLNYPCPVHTKKEDTDRDFNLSQKFCVEHIDRISFCSGTHNEESSTFLVQLIKEHNIDINDERIFFSQLLGMSDHISYNLAKDGYNVAKYVPYGPIKNVTPYLIRRAEENTSISGQINRELKNIIKERRRRNQLHSN